MIIKIEIPDKETKYCEIDEDMQWPIIEFLKESNVFRKDIVIEEVRVDCLL